MHFDWWTLVLQTVNFAVLVWLLHRFLYKPVLRMIDARRAEIQRQYDDAKATEGKAKVELAAVEAERAGIAAEREEALKTVTAQAQKAAEGRRAQADRDAQVLLDGARKTLAGERERALEEARRVALDLGAEIARRFLAEVPMQLRAEAWIERIDQHLKSLPKLELDALTRQFADGSSLIVVTAVPFPPAMREIWRNRLHLIFGDGVTIAFNVNLELIDGAELHFPTAVLRFSWQSAMTVVRSEVGLMPTLTDDLHDWLDRSRQRLGALSLDPRLEHIGRVVEVGDGVAMVQGLPETRLDELLIFEGGVRGLAVDLGEEMIGCVLLGDTSGIPAGSIVHGTGEVARVPVGDALLGRVVDALGAPLDGGEPLVTEQFSPVEQPAPAIIDRALVTRPLATGLLVVDAMIPLGRGQRELIIGDRGTGKTAIAVDTIINQRASDVICVYAAVGQKASSVARVIEAVRHYGAPERCLFVIGEADAAPGLQWLTPYAACTMAEYFMARGRDVLLVIDDLTKHAAAYRQVSLLLRRPPGREAYPGDIFYIHSRLLERAAKLAPEGGGGSLTALPIAETQAGNISAYIPTNLISITDGQIYLDPRLFYEDQKPAVDVGKSVSRVGGKTQAPVLKSLSESLRLEYAQFMELEVFTRFGTMVDERTRKVIEHGRRIRAVLSQRQFAPLALGEEIALLCALSDGVLDGVPLEHVGSFRSSLAPWLAEHCPEIMALDDKAKAIPDDVRSRLKISLSVLARSIVTSNNVPGAPQP